MTDIMGPVSKLWVLIENVNTVSGDNAPAVQMEMLLELL